MSYRHEPRQFWTSQEAEKVSNVFNNIRVPSDDVQRRKSFFFPSSGANAFFTVVVWCFLPKPATGSTFNWL